MSTYKNYTLYYMTPKTRRLGSNEALATKFGATAGDMERLRTVYRALRASGMSALAARTHIYDVVFLGMFAKQVKI